MAYEYPDLGVDFSFSGSRNSSICRVNCIGNPLFRLLFTAHIKVDFTGNNSRRMWSECEDFYG